MPTFELTIWATQLLRDEATYHVTAESKKEAAALLMRLHKEAEQYAPVDCPAVTCTYRVEEQQHQVYCLDPGEIVDGSEGVMDEDGKPVEIG